MEKENEIRRQLKRQIEKAKQEGGLDVPLMQEIGRYAARRLMRPSLDEIGKELGIPRWMVRDCLNRYTPLRKKRRRRRRRYNEIRIVVEVPKQTSGQREQESEELEVEEEKL